MGREQKPVRVLSEYEPRRRRRPTLVIWRHIGRSRRRRRKEEDLGTHQSDNNNNNKTNSFSAKASTAAAVALAGVTPEAEGEECRKNLIFAIHF